VIATALRRSKTEVGSLPAKGGSLRISVVPLLTQSLPVIDGGTSALPSSLAQSFERMGVVLRAVPRNSAADVEFERSGRNRDGLCQRFLSFANSADLAERRGKASDRLADGRDMSELPV
jgi:hypothetical protein